MKINIAASHRFHLLDLARELEALGHDVAFYSYVSPARMRAFGLTKRSSRSLLFILVPILGLVKISRWNKYSVRLLYWALDFLVAKFARPCDVFIGLGTVYLDAFERYKADGAVTIVEWGSTHIHAQQEALQRAPAFIPTDAHLVQRSCAAFELADFIAIPSDHVRDSFTSRGFAESRLIQNPYGVDLRMFFPKDAASGRIFDIITVGAWGYRKGADLIVEAFQGTEYSVLHVGPLGDVPFPKSPEFMHVDAVDQKTLIDFYSTARVFVLPSREEGLAMVQVQALACGLPLVCSRHTGGRDLARLGGSSFIVEEMEELTPGELLRCVKRVKSTRSAVPEAVRESISWTSYGKRYEDHLLRILESKS